ncbi:ferredoxin [Actinopolymorpha pittospori]
MPHIRADRDVCIGAGQCVLTAPDLFDSDDEGLVTLLDAHPDPSRLGDLREAVELCPSGALRLAEADEHDEHDEDDES